MSDQEQPKSSQVHGYLPNLEISEALARLMPRNCAVIERTGDGVSVGACTFYLEGGTTCPRHGRVKLTQTEPSE